VGNILIKEKLNQKIKNQSSNFPSKTNNFLSNKYMKLKNKPLIHKKRNKNYKKKRKTKNRINLNLKEEKHNKIIKGNNSCSRTIVSM
jgi:hypothetical protein